LRRPEALRRHRHGAQAGAAQVKTQNTLADLRPDVTHLDVACSRCDRRGPAELSGAMSTSRGWAVCFGEVRRAIHHHGFWPNTNMS